MTTYSTEHSSTKGDNAVRPSESVNASVLVVDDEPEVARVMARGLTYAGYDVSVAHSGEEALERLEEGAFDLLLTDVHMPGMHGDVLQRLARKRDPDLAVILITAAQDVTTAVECLREGAFDYMVKPAPLADVAVRVGKALERRRLVRENQDYQATLERRVLEQAGRIREMLLKSLETLSHALEAKDENTRNHSSRVADLVTALAGRLIPESETYQKKLRLAALLHDIGKIGVPEAILNKPGKLEAEEFAQIHKHPVVGETILRPLLEGEDDILAVVRHHHERWDGRGYPDGLKGEDTPLGARIAAVADSYDAMTSARPYRPGMRPEQALQVLKDGAGTQWDPDVVTAALELAEEGRFRPRTPAAPMVPPSPPVTLAPVACPGTASRPSLIFVNNHLDAKAAERLQIKVEALLERGRQQVALDMREVRALDTAAVLQIYQMHLRVQATGGRLVVRDVTEPAVAVFQEAGLAESLNFEPPFRYRETGADLDARRAA